MPTEGMPLVLAIIMVFQKVFETFLATTQNSDVLNSYELLHSLILSAICHNCYLKNQISIA